MLTIIDECASTNSALPRNAAHGDAIMALAQTNGRGQRGNSWEAEPRKNITLSMMIRPAGLPATRQFELSEAVALGVTDLLDDLGIKDVGVKWPNDIYAGNRKICGILIENTVAGALIIRSIAGIGLNVNQTQFRSDAPNPVSLKQITGMDFDLPTLAARMIEKIMQRLAAGNNHADYRRRLWRGVGEWPWRTSAGEEFTAAIADVLPDGRLLLAGRPSPYPFKSLAPVL